MAVLSAAQVDVLYDDNGGTLRSVLYRLQRVTTNDTFDVSDKFAKLVAAAFIGVTTQASVFSLPIAGTVITVNPGSLASDAVLVLVTGASAA